MAEWFLTVHCFNNHNTRKQPVAWKEHCAEYCLKKNNMDMYTGHRDITEILLKMALNTIQSINLSENSRKAWIGTLATAI